MTRRLRHRLTGFRGPLCSRCQSAALLHALRVSLCLVLHLLPDPGQGTPPSTPGFLGLDLPGRTDTFAQEQTPIFTGGWRDKNEPPQAATMVLTRFTQPFISKYENTPDLHIYPFFPRSFLTLVQPHCSKQSTQDVVAKGMTE